MKMGYLVVFLAMLVCSLIGSTTYYKVKCDKLVEKKYNYTQSQIEAKKELDTISDELQRLKSRMNSVAKWHLVDFVVPGVQIAELETRLDKIDNDEKLLKLEVYNAIKILTTYLRNTIDEDADVSTFVQCRKLSLLITAFCSDADAIFDFDEEGYVIQSAVDRMTSLEKVSERVEKCR